MNTDTQAPTHGHGFGSLCMYAYAYTQTHEKRQKKGKRLEKPRCMSVYECAHPYIEVIQSTCGMHICACAVNFSMAS